MTFDNIIGHRSRPRRMRRTQRIRDLVHETDLGLEHLIQGVFVTHGRNKKQAIASMPGIYRWSIDRLIPYVKSLADIGLKHIVLFGLPAQKDAMGSGADDENGIIQQALRALKRAKVDMTFVADTCLCEYTDHGHCGLPAVDGSPVDNESTLERLASLAVSQAEAGADIVAPSGMVDGTVAVVREALNRNNFPHVPILMYSVKYQSAFYGPFREAAAGAPQKGDRSSYQMDIRNAREALYEASLDIAEGADMLMVKPALSYLDVIQRLRQHCDLPIAAYNVSGEYAMVKAAAQNGWLDEQKAVLEILTSIRRAGADLILTYHAESVARWRQPKTSKKLRGN